MPAGCTRVLVDRAQPRLTSNSVDKSFSTLRHHLVFFPPCPLPSKSLTPLHRESCNSFSSKSRARLEFRRRTRAFLLKLARTALTILASPPVSTHLTSQLVSLDGHVPCAFDRGPLLTQSFHEIACAGTSASELLADDLDVEKRPA